MGTKNNPGRFDCYDKAEPDEPMFVLLARDKTAPLLVDMWVMLQDEINDEKHHEAKQCAEKMREWHSKNRSD